MRKFVNKNRPKRKYVRKSQKTPTYTFSKTIYSVLPLLITGVAFMATVIISTPFRNALSDIRFTFQIPQISFNNPVIFFQTLGLDFEQLGLFIQVFAAAIWVGIVSSVTNFSMSVTKSGATINPGASIKTIGNSVDTFGSSLEYVIVIITQGIADIVRIMLFSISLTQTQLNFITILLINLFFISGQFIFSFTTILLQIVSRTGVAVSQVIISTAITVFHIFAEVIIFLFNLISTIAITVWTWTVFIFSAILNAIGNAISAVVHVIEIPFKVLAAFGLRMKPYVDFFGRHVGMVGSDFARGVSSLGKAASYVGSK